MNFLSLFAGIGGFDRSACTVVAPFRIESNQPFAHERDSNFFKLVVPISVCLAVSNGEIGQVVIVFIKVNVMNAFVLAKRSSAFSGRYKNMLCDIARLVSVWVVRLKDVVVAVIKRSSLASLTFSFCHKDSSAFPVGVKYPFLVSLCSYSRFDSHSSHCCPNHFLSSAILGGYLVLAHLKGYIVLIKLFFSERYAISVLVAHSAGIISNASGY